MLHQKNVLETNPERYIYSLMNRSWLLYSYTYDSTGVLYTIWWVCVCTGGEYEWENDCCNCAHEHLLCIEILCCHNFNILNVYTLFLTVSSVSFRRCKVTTISGRFQEISSILLQLVWTNAFVLDKPRKSVQNLSRRADKWRNKMVFLGTSFWVSTSQRACHLVMHMLAAAEHLGCELRRLWLVPQKMRIEKRKSVAASVFFVWFLK